MNRPEQPGPLQPPDELTAWATRGPRDEWSLRYIVGRRILTIARLLEN